MLKASIYVYFRIYSLSVQATAFRTTIDVVNRIPGLTSNLINLNPNQSFTNYEMLLDLTIMYWC